MFIDLIGSAVQLGYKCAVLMDRVKLVQQTAERMRRVIPQVDVWCGSYGEKAIGPVTIVSVPSAKELTIEGLDILIIDECHRSGAAGYKSFIERHSGARIVGFTATPWKAGVEIFGPEELFKRVDWSVGMESLIKQGYLVKPVPRSVSKAFDTSSVETRAGDFVLEGLAKLTKDQKKIREQVADAIPLLTGRNKVVWTCVSIEHAENVADLLAALNESVVAIHSKSPDFDLAMKSFEHGHIRHAVSVMILSEGIDIPAVDAVVLMRPTQSPTLMVQTIGRALRPFPGKTDALILDYGEVIKNCGPVNDPYVRPPGKKKASREKIAALTRVCSECLTYLPASVAKCPNCGHTEQRIVDALAQLQKKAAQLAIMARPTTVQVTRVIATQHIAKNGNQCIRLHFSLLERESTSIYISGSHAFLWARWGPDFKKLTGYEFDSWREAYDAIPRIGHLLMVPKTVKLKAGEGGFFSITRINY